MASHEILNRPRTSSSFFPEEGQARPLQLIDAKALDWVDSSDFPITGQLQLNIPNTPIVIPDFVKIDEPVVEPEPRPTIAYPNGATPFLSRRDLFMKVVAPIATQVVKQTGAETAPSPRPPLNDDIILDLTRGDLIASLAAKHARDSGRLRSKPSLERLLQVDPTFQSLLRDPEFAKLFGYYGLGPHNFLTQMEERRRHRDFEQVLTSPVRADYLTAHRAEGLLASEDQHHERQGIQG